MGNSISKFINVVLRLWSNYEFLLLFFFNLLSNATAIQSYSDPRSIFLILTVSAFSGTLESLLCRFFGNKLLRACVLYFFVLLHLLTAIVDYFLIANFQLIFTHDILGIITETTPTEIESFFSSYVPVWYIVFAFVIVCAVVWLIVWISHKMNGLKSIALLSMFLSLFGVSVYVSMIYNHLTHGEGGASVSQLHSFSRFGYAYVAFKDIQRQILHMRDLNRNLIATSGCQNPPTIVVVIGESFSVYHSSLYSYSKETNPLISKRVQDGTMVVFDDVVSISDHTTPVFHSVLSVNGSNEPYANEVMFPTCFRKAGYKTVLIDNEYFVGNGYLPVNDKILSDIMFDFRNIETFGYDGNLFQLIPNFDRPQLILLHLLGQHFNYSQRYPANFKHFTASDYPCNLSESEREIIADYDNATLYNDFVVDSVIKKFENENCMIVYFSDHGQEIYEIDNFMGHGNAKKRPNIRYQIRVPFMIWMSSAFRAQYPDIEKKVKESVHKPIITDDLPHFLFDVASIKTKYYCPNLSFINDNYQAKKKRVVLNDIDYDKYIEEKSFKPRY